MNENVTLAHAVRIITSIESEERFCSNQTESKGFPFKTSCQGKKFIITPEEVSEACRDLGRLFKVPCPTDSSGSRWLKYGAAIKMAYLGDESGFGSSQKHHLRFVQTKGRTRCYLKTQPKAKLERNLSREVICNTANQNGPMLKGEQMTTFRYCLYGGGKTY